MRCNSSEPDALTGAITVSVNINLLDQCEAALGTLADIVTAYDREESALTMSEKGGRA